MLSVGDGDRVHSGQHFSESCVERFWLGSAVCDHADSIIGGYLACRSGDEPQGENEQLKRVPITV